MRSPQSASRGRLVVVLALIVCLLSSTFPGNSVQAATDLEIGGTAVIAEAQGDHVRLRDAPGLDGEIIDTFPEGTVVDVLDGLFEADDDSLWYQVEAGGETGYMISDYLFNSAGETGSDIATVTDDLNLRDGPSTADDVILVMPPGVPVEVTGASRNSFYPVVYDGAEGWAHSKYLSFDGSSGEGPTGDAVTTSDLNLRAGPSTADDVILVMPPGAAITLTGGLDNGF